jgi:hypothetical protein
MHHHGDAKARVRLALAAAIPLLARRINRADC